MAAVSSQILRLTAAPQEAAYEWRALLSSLPDPQVNPSRDSMAKFLAAHTRSTGSDAATARRRYRGTGAKRRFNPGAA